MIVEGPPVVRTRIAIPFALDLPGPGPCICSGRLVGIDLARSFSGVSMAGRGPRPGVVAKIPVLARALFGTISRRAVSGIVATAVLAIRLGTRTDSCPPEQDPRGFAATGRARTRSLRRIPVKRSSNP